LSCVAASSFTAAIGPEAIIVDAVRCWRAAIDRQSPVLPTLFARLEANGAGFLAPAIAALLAVHEAWSGQRFRAGPADASALTDDEHYLLGLLKTATPSPAIIAARPGLTGTLGIALRSTRIVLSWVLGRDLPPPSAPVSPQQAAASAGAATESTFLFGSEFDRAALAAASDQRLLDADATPQAMIAG